MTRKICILGGKSVWLRRYEENPFAFLKKSVFYQILRKKISILPNFKGKKSVYTDKISMSGRSVITHLPGPILVTFAVLLHSWRHDKVISPVRSISPEIWLTTLSSSNPLSRKTTPKASRVQDWLYCSRAGLKNPEHLDMDGPCQCKPNTLWEFSPLLLTVLPPKPGLFQPRTE